MRNTAACIGLLLALALPGHSVNARLQPTPPASCVSQNGEDLDQLVAGHVASSEQYRKVFRDLTAEETKTIEVYRASGEVEQRRQIVSDLVVYRSSRDGKDAVTEYRDVRSVDGKPVENRGGRALKLLTRAAQAPSLEKELEAINAETKRYEFRRRHVRGLTLAPDGLPAHWRGEFQVEVTGREQIAGHDVVVLAYRQTSPSKSNLPLPREFGSAKLHDRGWLWLDVQTCQLWRSIWELAAPHPAAADPLVMIHADRTFQPSLFGIMVPERIVFDWLTQFSHPKNGRPSFSLSERSTFTYSSFKRFGVATDEDVRLPEARGR
jgi:hypothetical protein